MYNSYDDNGVVIAPNVIAEGERATVIYKGILKNSGADAIYLRAGYGDSWKGSTDVKMNRVFDGFEAVLPVTCSNKLNIAFKDSANNWDNNSGRNYSFEVESR